MNKNPNHHDEPSAIGAFALRVLICIAFALLAPAAPAQVHSELWQTHIQGWEWDPETSRLKDFTNVGYMNGDVAIPDDWPVGANVLDFGATPNDGGDDSDAFNAAIAACPPNHKVYVPNGRYIMLKRVTLDRDYIVVSGQDMFQTVLFFPKNTNEAYINLEGYDPETRNTGVDPFFVAPGGTHRSIENLTFEFREQIKMGHWEHKGNDAIRHSGTDSWLRNLYIKNADHAIATGGSTNLSVVNIIFDQSVNRNKVAIEVEGSVVGHMAINLNDTRDCLFHNILLTGNWSHEFDEKSNSGNVISAVRSEIGVIAYHGQGSVGNLYTDLDVNGDRATTMGTSLGQRNETYWNVRSRSGRLNVDNVELPYYTDEEGNDHVFVGYDIDPSVLADKETPEFWYEAIEPEALSPQNIYLAQLAYRGKPIPPTPPLAVPDPNTGNVIRLEPVEDNSVSASSPDAVADPASYTLPVTDSPYLKFDLSGLSLSAIHRVRLKIVAGNLANVPFDLAAYSVADDSWSASTLTYNNRPAAIAALSTLEVSETANTYTMEFDVTPFVQAEWAGDKVVSLCLVKLSGNGWQSSIQSGENGFGPELIIEQVPEAAPGAPSAPTEVRSESLVGNIQLDWPDNPEGDVVSYNVYRSTVSADFIQYDFPIGMGLTTSDFVDIQESHLGGWDIGEVRDDIPHFYRVTAVDSHGRESASSLEIAGTSIGKNSTKQPPAFTAGSITLPAATQYLPYTATLAGTATDSEGDPLYYSLISAPDWLELSPDGTITGMPRLGETGLFEFQVQVSALGGGRDEATVAITVNPGVPDAPVFADILQGDSSIHLDWSHDSEGSEAFTFIVYRSTVPGGPYAEVAEGLTASNYTDTGLNNGIAHHYVVTASNSTGESPQSAEVFATPIDGFSNATNFIGGTLTDPAAWDSGLPVGQGGRIHMDATADTTIPADAYSVLHTGGTIMQTGLGALQLVNGTRWIMDGAGASTASNFRGFHVKSGSSFILNQGVINTSSGRDWKVEGADSSVTINGGTLNLGRNLMVGGSAGSSLTVNGGTLFGNPGSGDLGSGNLDDNAKSLNFNGGTTTINRITLAGDNTLFNFGGSQVGSLTTSSIVSFGANSRINFSPGTRMSMTVAGEDEWAAARWAEGRLTYNGQGVSELGGWAGVIVPDGLEAGAHFVYDSETETLSLVSADFAPAPPTGFAASAGDQMAGLNWNDSPEADVVGYTVYRSQTPGGPYQEIAAGLTESAYDDQGLTNGTTYHYVVTATDAASNESAYSAEQSATPSNVAPPAAPSDVEATSDASGIYLDWSHGEEGSVTFTVFRSTVEGGPYTEIATDLAVSEYSDLDVVYGTTYFYVVTASDAGGNPSGTSFEISATLAAAIQTDTNALGGLITDPANWDNGLPVGQLGGIAVDVTVDTSTALNNYSILHTAGTISQTGIPGIELNNGSSWVTDGATAKTATSFRGFSIKGGSSFTLNQGTIHTVSGKDWLLNDTGSSLTVNGGILNLGRSLLLSGTAGPVFTINGGIIQVNGTSGDIGGRNIYDNAKTLNFNGGSTTAYRIDLAGDNTVFNFGGTSEGTLTAVSFASTIGANSHLNFLPGTKMSVTLSASDEWAAAQWAAGKLRYNGQGVNELGTWAAVTAPDGLELGARFAYDSATETLTVDQVDLPPAPPSGLDAVAGDGAIQLQWAASPEPDFASYTVYRSETSGSGYLAIAAGITTPAFEDQGLTNGTVYHYVVTATDAAGNESVYSAEFSVAPVDLTPPQTPSGLVLYAGDGKILADWDDNCPCEDDAGLYTVYRSTSQGGGYEEIASDLSESRFLDTGASNGQTYHYVITAVDAAGNESPYSNEQSATPAAGIWIETNFLGGTITDSASWDLGPPTDFLGVIETDATVDTSVVLSGYHILHVAGTIQHTGIPVLELANGSTWVTDGATATTSTNFRGFRISGGSYFTLNQGTIHTVSGKDWYVNDTGSSMTVNGGVLNLGRHLLQSGTAGPAFTINGGVINGNVTAGDIGGRNIHDNAKAFNFNGGTTTTYRLELAGDNTVFNFGGTSAGSLTAVSFASTFGANSFLNFLPGSGMSLTISGSDQWAESLWSSGGLRYNGQGASQLGTWAAVTATGGLGDGHRFAYDSATETLTVTTAPVDDPPAAPIGLAAAAGIGSVTLDWADNSESDLASYTVYRSNTAGTIGTVVASGLTDSSHTDIGLEDHSTYHYTVVAVDLADQESGPSGQESATPGTVANYTTAVIDVEGTVSGSASGLDLSDNSYQTITEISDGTTSRLEHVWLFDVVAAEVVTFHLEAHHTANSEGDQFVFSFSTDGVNYADMLTVTKTSDDGTSSYFTLPSGISGTVYVRVRDTDRSPGNTELDSIIIDRLVIGSETSSAAPTAASEPSPADGAADVPDTAVLSWKAGQGTVSHEVFFGTSPNPESQGTQSGTTFAPGLLLPNTTYYWSVAQANSSGTTPGPVWSFTTGNVSPRLSTGLITGVGDSWQTVTLPHAYHSAVVVASVVYADSTVAPAVARIRNVSGNTLELKVQNPSGLPLSGYGVHLVVVEEGVYTAAEHGVNLEALKVTCTGTNENNNWNNPQRVQLQPANSYTSPVVLGQVMSASDGKWSVFWAGSSSRTNPATASSIYVGRHVGEDTDIVRSAETLGVILVESGNATFDGSAFTAMVGPASVGGIDYNPPYTYTLSGLPAATEVAVSSAGMRGPDGGWPVLFGPSPVSATHLSLAIDEDQVLDTERNHTNENVSYIVFE